MPFDFKKLELEGLVLIEPKVFTDERGFFLESYKKSDFLKYNINSEFVQDNHSVSKKNVIRGLHYQHAPKAQGKLVRAIRGTIWDVAVDIRRGSRTFLKSYFVELSDKKNNMLFIPPGFAHGFAALTDDAHLVYKCTEEYDQALDAGIRWDDSDIGVKWPVDNPIISVKDMALPYSKNAKLFD